MLKGNRKYGAPESDRPLPESRSLGFIKEWNVTFGSTLALTSTSPAYAPYSIENKGLVIPLRAALHSVPILLVKYIIKAQLKMFPFFIISFSGRNYIRVIFVKVLIH